MPEETIKLLTRRQLEALDALARAIGLDEALHHELINVVLRPAERLARVSRGEAEDTLPATKEAYLRWALL